MLKKGQQYKDIYETAELRVFSFGCHVYIYNFISWQQNRIINIYFF